MAYWLRPRGRVVLVEYDRRKAAAGFHIRFRSIVGRSFREWRAFRRLSSPPPDPLPLAGTSTWRPRMSR
jgi:hypothetical protein